MITLHKLISRGKRLDKLANIQNLASAMTIVLNLAFSKRKKTVVSI